MKMQRKFKWMIFSNGCKHLTQKIWTRHQSIN